MKIALNEKKTLFYSYCFVYKTQLMLSVFYAYNYEQHNIMSDPVQATMYDDLTAASLSATDAVERHRDLGEQPCDLCFSPARTTKAKLC